MRTKILLDVKLMIIKIGIDDETAKSVVQASLRLWKGGDLVGSLSSAVGLLSLIGVGNTRSER